MVQTFHQQKILIIFWRSKSFEFSAFADNCPWTECSVSCGSGISYCQSMNMKRECYLQDCRKRSIGWYLSAIFFLPWCTMNGSGQPFSKEIYIKRGTVEHCHIHLGHSIHTGRATYYSNECQCNRSYSLHPLLRSVTVELPFIVTHSKLFHPVLCGKEDV